MSRRIAPGIVLCLLVLASGFAQASTRDEIFQLFDAIHAGVQPRSLPEEVRASDTLGLFYANRGDAPSAEKAYREALTLNTVHGLTPTQIAQAAGISPNTVKTRLHRARNMLESALPAGLATGLALLTTQAQGLAAVRTVVLEHAGLVLGSTAQRHRTVGPFLEAVVEVELQDPIVEHVERGS